MTHPDFVQTQVSRSATANLNMTRELETARKQDAESSGDERVKNSKDSFIILSGFNKSLREANLRKQADLKVSLTWLHTYMTRVPTPVALVTEAMNGCVCMKSARSTI